MRPASPATYLQDETPRKRKWESNHEERECQNDDYRAKNGPECAKPLGPFESCDRLGIRDWNGSRS